MLEIIENGTELPILIIDDIEITNYQVIEAFPLQNSSYKHISICNEFGNEIYLIKDLFSLPSDQQLILSRIIENNRPYKIINKIISIIEHPPHERWTIDIQSKYTDIFIENLNAIIPIKKDSLLIQDIDKKKFFIPNVCSLDENSKRQLRHYLKY